MSQDKSGSYIALLSIHGLIRGHNLELGRDADTGGQTLYVVEFAQALAKMPQISRVDLITRLVDDPSVDADYARPFEKLSEKASIIRIKAGPDEYIAKEQLWDYLPIFTDNLAAFFKAQDGFPDILHSHYADAGYVGSQLANQTGTPLVHTGHSLGRVKRSRLLANGKSGKEIEKIYNLTRRIEAEETTLATAERVITSTNQEIEEQYELYDFYQPEQMRVVPPGTNLRQFHAPTGNETDSALFRKITAHLMEPDKPVILTLSRPDSRKNIPALVEAYGRSKKLQKLANLIIVAGNRDDIDNLEQGAREVFQEMLVAIDRYDLYGKVAMPKHHQRSQVPAIYRIAAATGGIFVNPALTEPFGLTLIEAAASGLPLVATEDGGPRDIIGNCQNGILVDPLEPESISLAMEKLLRSKKLYRQYRDNGIRGVREHYSWQAHARRYLEIVLPLAQRSERLHRKPLHRRSEVYPRRAMVSDLDLNLIGGKRSLHKLLKLLREHRKSTLFIIATGRRLDNALKLMKKHGIPEPDVLITSSGSEIYYAPKLTTDEAWIKHIDYQWSPHKIQEVLDAIDGLIKQEKQEQSRFKISYYINPEVLDVETIKSALHNAEITAHVQVAFGQYLDVLPVRASKGMALRYVADNLEIPWQNIFVAGGSGADEGMMQGNTMAAVVANRNHEELSQLVDIDNIYFASKSHADGILEALQHYDFFNVTSEKIKN